MKKHYEKMCMTPLGVVFEGQLLANSVVDNVTAGGVIAAEQEVYEADFSTSDFNFDWDN